ncbi:MFS transporter [Arenibacter sp. 6A1]|uniref:MFS transporter n=1 Tax=Arenibacter sp. 6A1 TaxID=2720391 RepID=UPI00197C02C5|nr:MFS transporter [Arenibacter sp. 6A1]
MQKVAQIDASASSSNLSGMLILLMAVTCGVVVANIYYNQPLLIQIAETFGVSEQRVSWIATITQVGYTLGLFFVVPLGDKVERKKLILIKLVGAALALFAAAMAGNFYVLLAASLYIGFFSAVPQLLLPMAASLANDKNRGKVLGQVMSGLLVGILLSRTLSGFMGAAFGWRTVFYFGTLVMILLMALLYWKLPKNEPEFLGSYGGLMRSMLGYIKELPVLRTAAVTGFFMFGAFSIFWTTLVFLLEGKPFFYESDMVGLFGLIGTCGALAAPMAGKWIDKKGAQFAIRIGIFAVFLAFVVMDFSATSLLGLILGVVLLDIGLQVTHVSNQSKVFALVPEARSRLNTIYISASFAGGSIGSLMGAMAWTYWHWTGVCVLGAIFVAIALVINLRK